MNEPLASTAAQDTRVRIAVYESTVTAGLPPESAALASRLGLPRAEIAASLQRLAAARALVLQPESGEILMASPFSAVPTPSMVECGARRYFGNCIWDALGIPAMLGRDARIDASCGCCGEATAVAVEAGELAPLDGVVHFAVPARRWWEDIVFC